MKALRPMTTLLLGSMLLGFAVAACGAAVLPQLREPRGIAICWATGTALGLLVFLPIAAGEGTRSRFVRRHFEHFERWSSVLLAMGVGHWLFSGIGDAGSVLAFVLVFVAACFRVYLSTVAKRSAA